MTKDYSPFTPGQPASNELFVGRKSEVERLVKMVGASVTGRLQMAYLSGERGIGKSSIASFVRRVCEQKHRVLGVHAYLGGVNSLEDMVSRIFNQILKVTHENDGSTNSKGYSESTFAKSDSLVFALSFARQQRTSAGLYTIFQRRCERSQTRSVKRKPESC